jgi:hypothetical protein
MMGESSKSSSIRSKKDERQVVPIHQDAGAEKHTVYDQDFQSLISFIVKHMPHAISKMIITAANRLGLDLKQAADHP